LGNVSNIANIGQASRSEESIARSSFDLAGYSGARDGVTVFLTYPGAQMTGAGTHTISNFEGLSGSLCAERLTGDANASRLVGLDGNDTLEREASSISVLKTRSAKAARTAAASSVTRAAGLPGAAHGLKASSRVSPMPGSVQVGTTPGRASARRRRSRRATQAA